MFTSLPILQDVDVESVEGNYLEFFRQRGYASLPGSPLVDESIPMSFVMSAGLVQVEKARIWAGQSMTQRFALVQSCFRHFDMMESFGTSSYHLSLFRMAGAFCFGPVDRRARIAEIWKLLSSVYHLELDSLWATYFSGGSVNGHFFESDNETCSAWRAAGLLSEHIIPLAENFWKQSDLMGNDHNPPKRGLNCELFYDRGKHLACAPACRPGCGCGRFVEFMNLIYVEWERDLATDSLHKLEKPFVEMVIGVERLAMILQGSHSIYEVESLPLLTGVLEEFTGATALRGSERETQMRLLADHLRAMLFLVADGAPPPGKSGQARIMRRLARNLLVAQKLLDLPMQTDQAFSFALPVMLDELLAFYRVEAALPGQTAPRMLTAHPSLPSARDRLLSRLDMEARLFEQTLQKGLARLDAMLARRPDGSISGHEMFELEISAGIPILYLTHVLNKKQVHYSLSEYRAEREHWRASNSRGVSLHGATRRVKDE